MNKLRTILKWRWIRALQIWNLAPIRAQGGIVALIPFIALLVPFIAAFYGNQTRQAIEGSIQLKFRMVRQYNDLMTLVIDAETGERGYLLTHREEYLAPYQKASEEIPKTISLLTDSIRDEPGRRPRIERQQSLTEIQDLINQELALLKESRDFTSKRPTDDELYAHLQKGKALMDEIRSRIGNMQNIEGNLLTERIEEVNAIRQRDYILIFVSLLIGFIARVITFYLFDRGIVRRISRLTENVRAIRKGQDFKSPASKKTDAVGMLEKEISELAEQRKEILSSQT